MGKCSWVLRDLGVRGPRLEALSGIECQQISWCESLPTSLSGLSKQDVGRPCHPESAEFSHAERGGAVDHEAVRQRVVPKRVFQCAALETRNPQQKIRATPKKLQPLSPKSPPKLFNWQQSSASCYAIEANVLRRRNHHEAPGSNTSSHKSLRLEAPGWNPKSRKQKKTQESQSGGPKADQIPRH